jgi:hypothetical protein
MVIQNDTEFEATQYRLTQFEKVVCGLRHELSARAFADCVQGYMIEIQRMRNACERISTTISCAHSRLQFRMRRHSRITWEISSAVTIPETRRDSHQRWSSIRDHIGFEQAR